MFNNCGKTIKTIAKTFFMLCIAAAVIILIAKFADMRNYLLGSTAVTVIVVAALVVCGVVTAPMIYGFGEIVECVKEIRDQGNK